MLFWYILWFTHYCTISDSNQCARENILTVNAYMNHHLAELILVLLTLCTLYFTLFFNYFLQQKIIILVLRYTVGKKSIRALEMVLAIFLCFECQFLSFYACYKEYKA